MEIRIYGRKWGHRTKYFAGAKGFDSLKKAIQHFGVAVSYGECCSVLHQYYDMPKTCEEANLLLDKIYRDLSIAKLNIHKSLNVGALSLPAVDLENGYVQFGKKVYPDVETLLEDKGIKICGNALIHGRVIVPIEGGEFGAEWVMRNLQNLRDQIERNEQNLRQLSQLIDVSIKMLTNY